MSSGKYIPPSLRRKMAAEQAAEGDISPPPGLSQPPVVAAFSDKPAQTGRGRFIRSDSRPVHGESGSPSQAPDGAWVIPGRPRPRDNERSVFGEPNKDSAGGTVYRDVNVFDGIPISLEGSGHEAYASINDFTAEENGLHPLVLANISKIGYVRPSPVQMWSIPIMMGGRDLMACAQTGSGKTAGFLTPIISGLLKMGPPSPDATERIRTVGFTNPETPSALCMSPTRELATQIFDEAKKFTFRTGIRPVVVYGGTPIYNQTKEIKRGCDLCIGTPGRLIDLVDRGSLSMSQIKYFVLDEADRMLDMGFAPQIEHIVTSTGMPDKNDRQTVMFSATFPKQIQNMARNFMKDYLYLTIGRVGSTNDCIRQDVVFCSEADKPDQLIHLLNTVEGLTLIFVDTKRRCDNIASFLNMHNIGAVAIHGDRSQAEREQALNLFKTGKASVMVATDVASRGLDINNVAHVINVDVPSNIDDYVHRIGRTGRAGNKGIATSLINEKNSGIVRELIKNLSESKQEVPKFLMDMVSRSGMGGRRGGGYRGGGGHGGDFRRGMRTNNY